MERDSKVVILYRVAEKASKNSKVKPDWINNANCLKNLARNARGVELHVFGDRLQESKELAQEVADQYHEVSQHGNSESFLEVLNYGIENFDNNTLLYFVEDDYIHRPDFVTVLKEGIRISDYVSLYDHPDKYEYEPEAQLVHTKSTHWRYTTSTTMTFAAKVKTLTHDFPIFEKYIKGTNMPPDYYLWNYLTSTQDRSLATPVPGYSTHGETAWLSPIIDWELECVKATDFSKTELNEYISKDLTELR